MSEIRVALVDDHPVVLAGVRALLQSAPEVTLVGEATSGTDGLKLICESLPDVAVIDMSLPDFTGAELARRVMSTCPDVKLLALTVHEDRAYVQPLLQAGARGYLLKRSAAEDLVRAIRAVAAGGMYLDPAIVDKALSDVTRPSQSARVARPAELSEREAEVLQFTAQGFSNKEIATKLDISVKTVETYKARAAEKLDLRTRADIVRYGVSRGWLDDIDRA